MWDWLRRVWDDLRRLAMNVFGGDGGGENEPLEDDGIVEGDEEVGRELQAFFLELLQGDNLKRYQGPGRREYLNDKRLGLSPEAWRVLTTGNLQALEAHIGAITGSKATLLYVVCPPM